MLKKVFYLIFLVSLSTVIFAQEDFTDCQHAFSIANPIDWCSESGAFNNIDVSNSGYNAPSCWIGGDHDIWFEFTAFATAVNIIVDGNSFGNNLNNPQVALFSGDCGGTINELACGSNVTGPDVVSVFETALVIGQHYFIRVNGRAGEQGRFSLCINNYNPPVEPGQDCVTAAALCDKSPFVVQVVTGSGNNSNEADGTCIMDENQSTWIYWTAANDGTLTFTLTPLIPSDDIDFVVYRFLDGYDCSQKEVVRCVATSCSGPTGLDLTSTDFEEDFNCEPNEDGFVRFIDMVEGETYGVLINNFSNSGAGVTIEFGGTGEFLGPTADFTIDPEIGLTCDEQFTITDQSFFPGGLGNIVSWNWNFGDRAIPQTADTPGPHIVEYEKFGEKFIVLEIETDKGCIVTSVLPLNAAPCCEDLPDIDVQAIDVGDLICSGEPEGYIVVEGSGGTPEYEYSLNGSPYVGFENFENLLSGEYQINIIDIKGCKDSISVFVGEPDPFEIEAGEDQEVLLGYSADLLASISPPGKIVDIMWSPDTLISCNNCFDPTVIPPGTTTYYITVTDEDGCMSIDSVTIRVKYERPLYTPTIFSPNGDGINEYFNIFSGPAGSSIDELSVFDRWGNLMYLGTNITLGETRDGWNGQFNGRDVNSGVYAWMAKIRFIDNVVITYSGSITLVR